MNVNSCLTTIMFEKKSKISAPKCPTESG